jgi:hypothetical protein
MPNTVARPILAINAIPVNKDFREGERRDRMRQYPTRERMRVLAGQVFVYIR